MPSTPATPLPTDIQRLQSSATRLETPCGTGTLVWHAWQATPGNASPDLPPVVLLHGGSGSWTHWLHNIAPLLRSERRVYAHDLPGFGDSDKPDSGHDADVMIGPIVQGLQSLLGEVACDLIGFSFGGMVAGFLAAQFPARVRRLVLVGAPGMGLASRNTVPLFAWRHVSDLAERQAIHRKNMAALMLYRPEAITALALRIHTDNTVRSRMNGRRLAYTDALLQALQSVLCPVHAIYGREDALYLQRQEALASALQTAPTFQQLQWIEDAGHWVQFEQAQAFDAALLAALTA
jgi:2-hydroxy-6-oxonona-2,4-dienedioate hydrolase